MKKLFSIFSFFFSLVVSAQQFPAGDIFYTVPVLSSSGTTVHAEWWHEYMDQPQHDAFFKPLLDLVDNGTITAYVPEYPFTKAMSIDEVHALLHKTDTAYYDYGYLYDGGDYYLVHQDITPDKILSVSFHEEWEYDSLGRSLVRKVKGITLNTRSIDSEFPQGAPLFYIRFDGKANNEKANDHPQVFSLTYDLHTRDFDHIVYSPGLLFSGDSLMGKKLQDKSHMIIHSLVDQKKITFYDTLYPYNKPIDKKALKTRMPEISKADNIRFMEDWYVDLRSMTFTKAIRGIVLEKEIATEKTMGEWGKYTQVSYKRLAFVPTNNYKPELVLSNPFWNAAEINIPGFIYRENFFTNPIVHRDETVFSDSAALMKMCIGICNLAEKKKIIPYYYSGGSFDGDKINFRSRETDSLFSQAHNENLPAGLFDPNYYGNTPFYYPKTGGLAFKENWVYNDWKNTFGKEIISISYLSTQLVNAQESNFMMPLFYLDLPPVADTAKIMKPEFLVAKNIHSPVMIDHAWETSDEERRYSPQAFKNESAMDVSIRYHFIEEILDNVMNGKIMAYDGTKTDVQLSPAQLQSKIDKLKDSSYVRTDLPADYLLFQELVFVEDWYFNPATGELYKKVNEIIFVNSDNSVSPYYIDFEKQNAVFAIKLN